MPFYTIGYEGVKLDAFLSCLKQNDIRILADVRERPFSLKAGFSQKALRNFVSSEGIRYKHFPKLGCPPDIRKNYQADGNWGSYRAAFNQYLAANLNALQELVDFARGASCALMCFEANPKLCHRFLIAQQIEKQCHEPFRNLHPKNLTRPFH